MTKFNDDYIKYAEMCAKVVKNEMDEFVIGIGESKIAELVGRFGFLAMKNVGYLKAFDVGIGTENRKFYKILDTPVQLDKLSESTDKSFEAFVQQFYPEQEIIVLNPDLLKKYLNWKYGNESVMQNDRSKKTCANCSFGGLLPYNEPCKTCLTSAADTKNVFVLHKEKTEETPAEHECSNCKYEHLMFFMNPCWECLQNYWVDKGHTNWEERK